MNDYPPDWKLLLRVMRRTKHRVLIGQIRADANYWKVAYVWDQPPSELRRGKPVMTLGTPQKPDPNCISCAEQTAQ